MPVKPDYDAAIISDHQSGVQSSTLTPAKQAAKTASPPELLLWDADCQFSSDDSSDEADKDH